MTRPLKMEVTMIDLNEVQVSAGTGVHFSGQHLQKLIYLYKSMALGVVCNAQGKTIQFGHQIKKTQMLLC